MPLHKVGTYSHYNVVAINNEMAYLICAKTSNVKTEDKTEILLPKQPFGDPSSAIKENNYLNQEIRVTLSILQQME